MSHTSVLRASTHRGILATATSWMMRTGMPPATLLLLLVLAVCAPADLLLLRNGADEAAWAVMIAGVGCALALAFSIIRAERGRHAKVLEAERLHADAFQYACTSIWVEDWTEVGRALSALRGSGLDPAGYFAANPILVRQLHESVRIVDVNDSTVELMGVGERAALIGRLKDVIPASVHTFDAWLGALARGDRAYRAESLVQRPDGTARDCLVMAALPTDAESFSRLLVSVFDVTDYKADQARLVRAEREVARASRLLTVGVLTGSIAHEVNNPLAAAITSAEAALRWLGRREPDLGEAVAAIEGGITAARRAQDVVDRTRRLVTRERLDTQALDATATLGAAVAVMARELNDGRVIVSTTVRPGLPRMQADPVQVQQVLINLLQNAVRAMRAEGERLVTLEASPHAEGVCVRVGDNGIGIPPDIRDHLFEPFATTRPDGMGLGLAVCKACVEVHGGRLWVEDVPGQSGTTFCFTLPAAYA